MSKDDRESLALIGLLIFAFIVVILLVPMAP